MKVVEFNPAWYGLDGEVQTVQFWEPKARNSMSYMFVVYRVNGYSGQKMLKKGQGSSAMPIEYGSIYIAMERPA